MELGFVYLTAVVDVYNRKVLAHRVAITMEALQEVLRRYGTPEIVTRLSIHGSRACRYRTWRWGEVVDE
jgi:transposase InsO family protein